MISIVGRSGLSMNGRRVLTNGSSGFLSFSAMSIVSIVDTVAISTIANVHSGNSMFVQNGTGGTRLFTVDGATGIANNYSQLPATADIRSMVVVVAPEPGTMIALGLGGLAMLRRRRAQKH